MPLNRRIKIAGISTGLFLGAWMIAAHYFFRFRISDKKFEEKLSGTAHKIIHYDTLKHHIRCLQAGNDTLPAFILLHGGGASASLFLSALTDTALTNHYKLISADRPGYGYSNFGKAVPSFKQQAILLQPLINKCNNGKPVYLMGSSAGGPVALSIAANNPTIITKLIFCYVPFNGTLEKPNKAAVFLYKYLPALLPVVLRTTLSEKTAREKELSAFTGWNKIIAPVCIIQGTKDKLVYFENVQVAQQKLVNAKALTINSLPGMGHSLYDSHPDVLKKLWLHFLQ
jgi:pimeloyl-ACP methyl ester carboxylesterase